MDITLKLKKGNVANNFQERGDVIDVFKTPVEGVGNPGVKFYFLHITGFPDISNAKAKRWREKMICHDWVGTGVFGPDGIERKALRNSRCWSVPGGALPQAARDAFLNNGELTVTWAQAKPYVMEKLSRILRDDSDGNQSYDPTDHRSITDEDVIGA